MEFSEDIPKNKTIAIIKLSKYEGNSKLCSTFFNDEMSNIGDFLKFIVTSFAKIRNMHIHIQMFVKEKSKVSHMVRNVNRIIINIY